MGIKINEYPLERLQFGDDDFYDIDYWNGSTFETAKIKGSTIKNAIQSGISGKNIYEDDDALTDNRTMDGANFKLLLEDLGQFRVKASNSQNDSVIFEVNAETNKTGVKGFIIKDQGTQNPKFEVFDGKIKINGEYTLPEADGTSGQVMTTDGAGTVSFVTPQNSGVGGSGTLNTVAKWTPNGTTLGDSQITDDASEVTINKSATTVLGESRLIIDEASRGKTVQSLNEYRENNAVSIEGKANGQKLNLINIGVKGLASESRPDGDTPNYNNIGVKGQGGKSNLDVEPNGCIGVSGCAYESNDANYGGVFAVESTKGQSGGVGVYIHNSNNDEPLQIPEGAQIGRSGDYIQVLACIDTDGKTNWRKLPQEIQAACSDETTPLQAANDVLTFRVPNDFFCQQVRASLTTNTGTTLTEIGVTVNGSNLFVINNLTIDGGELTSKTAATQVGLDPSVQDIDDDAEIKVSILNVPSKAVTGLKITFIGHRA